MIGVFRERKAFKNQVTLVLCSTLDLFYWRDLYKQSHKISGLKE